MDLFGIAPTANICTPTGCTSYDIDGTSVDGAATLAASQPYASLQLRGPGVDDQNGIRTILDQSDGVLVDSGAGPIRRLGAYRVHAAALDDDGAVQYVIAAVDDADNDGKKDILIGWGPVDAEPTHLTVAPLAVNGVTYDAREVSVHAEAGRAVFAASGDGDGSTALDDIVAWQFFATP